MRRIILAAVFVSAGALVGYAQTPPPAPPGQKTDPQDLADAAAAYAQAMLNQAMLSDALLKTERKHAAALQAQIDNLTQQLKTLQEKPAEKHP